MSDVQTKSSPEQHSTALPFGQNITLSSISGPTYVTGQTLVQQVAFSLSDVLYTYSPDTFDLDVSLKYWQQQDERNVHGFAPSLLPMDTRTGAGAVALGYMFCNDFDANRRHLPQSLLASSGSLTYLRHTFSELITKNHNAKPTVVHVAAVDYQAGNTPGLVNDYVSAQSIADQVGMALVTSSSPHEMQHMSLFATLMAILLPTIHIYDGIATSRLTTRVIDVLDKTGLQQNCHAILQQLSALDQKNATDDVKVHHLLHAFNNQFGTDYRPFEYHGHKDPLTVFVVFGTAEASLACQIARALASQGYLMGVVNVRVYRPFTDAHFLQTLPASVKRIAVLGQVATDVESLDQACHSSLYADVLAALSFASHFTTRPTLVDLKYSTSHTWDPSSLSELMQRVASDKPANVLELAQPVLTTDTTSEYSFWDLDGSAAVTAPELIAQLLVSNAAQNVSLQRIQDNLVQGGATRVDLRTSNKTIETTHSITAAHVTYIGSVALLDQVDVLQSVKDRGTVIVSLTDFKLDDIEKRLDARTRRTLAIKGAQLYVLDAKTSGLVNEDPSLESYLVQLAFLKLARTDVFESGLAKVSQAQTTLDGLLKDLEKALQQITVPEAWQSLEPDTTQKALLANLRSNSFVPVTVPADESLSQSRDWTAMAKAFAFKEAYGTQSALRPDLPMQTSIIHVRERRRLTPASYDRNIFHIDFDLGDSGLTYQIGEALGVHAENDKDEVLEFIKWYRLDADEIVQVASREDNDIFEARTVYQALLQNIDIFGRPPKRFYEALAEFADDEAERKQLLLLGTGGNQESQVELKRRAEVDTVTCADVLLEFSSAHPSIHDVMRIVSPMKRREYSVASSQKVQPNTISLLIVTVNWVDPKGRDRFGQCTRYLNSLPIGAPITVSIKPSVMKLPPKSTQPIIMAGLGTGLAPFRAFVQERAWQKQQGQEIGDVMLYMGARHQREEYLYGEEWEAYRDAGVITHMGCAFSRDQAQKIYIQDRMRQSLDEIRKSYLRADGAFYLCGPTWPVPDVTNVLEEAIVVEAKAKGEKVDSRKEIDRLKDELRYVLEVY